jgi:hypothetical protein
MNKAAKKSVKKRSTVASAVKPVKKRSKSLSATVLKPAKKSVKRKLDFVPVAEVEVLAARAVRLIKASRKLSADEKADSLARVARTLGNARGWGGLSKAGAWMLAHRHEPVEPYDIEAVLL